MLNTLLNCNIVYLLEKRLPKAKLSPKVSTKTSKQRKTTILVHPSVDINEIQLSHKPPRDTSESHSLQTVEIPVHTVPSSMLKSPNSTHINGDDGRCDYEEIASPPRAVYMNDTEDSRIAINVNNDISELNLNNFSSVQNNFSRISIILPDESLLGSVIDSDSNRFLSSVLNTPVYRDVHLSVQNSMNGVRKK